ncbi:hypothetical protein K2173_028065 [Erythroxylum novogranatense]|uniref:RING-type domain-containing protein n=1 Tax=Erythroxylum novogranatense TaxID=1862640 RepID=A0AAV8U114_9ROSI|nr:hypothetical protein K2173_028065 [Erythroxylum novogranatense]
MALHLQHLFQQQCQPQQQQPQPPKTLRDLFSTDGQISPPAALSNAPNLLNQYQHPPYVPPCIAPLSLSLSFMWRTAAGPVSDVSDVGVDLQWNCGLEPKRKRLKEQNFFRIIHQCHLLTSCKLDRFPLGWVCPRQYPRSTSGDSALISLIGDDIELELLRQDADIDRFLKVEVHRLQQNILENFQTNQVQTISLMEEKILQKLHEKEAEMHSINKKNAELEERMEQLSVEVCAWQEQAMYNENVIDALKFKLEQVYAQSRDSKERCGNSEVDDTASCCNGRASYFHLICKDNNDMKELMTCKVCRLKEVCMLLLPCKHLCLCKDCESKVSFCPVCRSLKYFGMEVYM